MKLDNTLITISLTDENRNSFKKLDSIRPNHISFSQFLGISAEEYSENHKEGFMKITDFTNKDAVHVPLFFAEIDKWKKYIDSMPRTDIKKFQQRLQQINNIMNKKVQEIIK